MATEPRFDAHLQPCRYCQELVIWADSPGGERTPFDADPSRVHEAGQWALTPGERVKAAQVTRGQAAGMRSAGVVLYPHHGLTCVEREKWYRASTHGRADRHYRSRR